MTFTTGIICHDGDVRLVNGSGPHEGRVEVCFNETWGTICSYIHRWNWNTTQADIVCQQLGYSGAGMILLLLLSHCLIHIMLIDKSTLGFGRGSLPVLVKHVYCRGHESNIGECIYYTTRLSDCLRYESDVIGVHCISSIISLTNKCMNTRKNAWLQYRCDQEWRIASGQWSS
jgi:hypothetical protein